MKQKITALLLLLALFTGLLAGCGNSEDTDTSEADAAETDTIVAAEEETAETVQEDAAADTEENTAAVTEDTAGSEEAEASDADSADTAEPEQSAVEGFAGTFPGSEVSVLPLDASGTLPLTEQPETLTWMLTAPSRTGAFRKADVQSYAELDYMQELQEMTGITLELVELSADASAADQALYLASGESVDLITELQYPGGLAAAEEDGFILDLTDLLETQAPVYAALLAADPNHTADFLTDGRVLSFRSVYDSSVNSAGLVIRSDWLEDSGLDTPQTYADLEEVLAAFRTENNAAAALYLDEECSLAGLSAGYGIAAFSLTDDCLPLYVEDGEVKCTLTADGFYEYLVMLHTWYQAGYIASDFYNLEYDAAALGDLIEGGKTGVWSSTVEDIDSWEAEILPLPAPVTETGDTDHVTSVSLAAGSADTCISAGSEHVELAMALLDWFYTAEGIAFCNYGVEGEDYTLDTDGTPEFADAVLQNDYNLDTADYMRLRCGYGLFSTVQLQYRTADEYSSLQKQALQIWSENLDGSMAMPDGICLNAEEQAVLDEYLEDILAFARESIPEFINGMITLKEWYSYASVLDTLGLTECLEAEQAAYDRFMLYFAEEETAAGDAS